MADINQTNEELKRIDAKRQLNLPLTEREQALWTLYGEQYEAQYKRAAAPAPEQVAPFAKAVDAMARLAKATVRCAAEISEHARKALFVNNHLCPMLRDMTDGRVANATYIYDEKTHEEYVVVLFSNGYTKRKCVTADSLSAMVADVVQGL